MKNYTPKILGVIALAIVLNVALWPSTKHVWSQSVSIYGTTDGGTSRVPIKADASGNLYLGNAALLLSPINATWSFSQVGISTTVAAQLTVANPLRKALLIFNQSAVALLTGLTSPVTSGNAYSQIGQTVFPPTNMMPPTNAIYALGLLSGGTQTVSIFEGQ